MSNLCAKKHTSVACFQNKNSIVRQRIRVANFHMLSCHQAPFLICSWHKENRTCCEVPHVVLLLCVPEVCQVCPVCHTGRLSRSEAHTSVDLLVVGKLSPLHVAAWDPGAGGAGAHHTECCQYQMPIQWNLALTTAAKKDNKFEIYHKTEMHSLREKMVNWHNQTFFRHSFFIFLLTKRS